jgi:hypothetical protein
MRRRVLSSQEFLSCGGSVGKTVEWVSDIEKRRHYVTPNDEEAAIWKITG